MRVFLFIILLSTPVFAGEANQYNTPAYMYPIGPYIRYQPIYRPYYTYPEGPYTDSKYYNYSFQEKRGDINEGWKEETKDVGWLNSDIQE